MARSLSARKFDVEIHWRATGAVTLSMAAAAVDALTALNGTITVIYILYIYPCRVVHGGVGAA